MNYIKRSTAFVFAVLFAVLCSLTPASPANAATQPVIFIGDSRTEGMAAALSSKQKRNIVFYAATAQGFSWFEDDVISKVNTKLFTYPHTDFKIVISLGINDHVGNISRYAEIYNKLAKNEWADFEIYIVSICPVDEVKMKANCLYPQTNASIKKSNRYLKRHLDAPNLHYVNLYKKMQSGSGLSERFDTVYDGAHYTSDTYVKMWKMIKKKINS